MARSPNARVPAASKAPSTFSDTAPARAKVIADGRGQAVRLPKAFHLPGDEVIVRREGACLVLEPVGERGWPVDLWKRLDEIAAGVDDWERPADAPPPPIERERELP